MARAGLSVPDEHQTRATAGTSWVPRVKPHIGVLRRPSRRAPQSRSVRPCASGTLPVMMMNPSINGQRMPQCGGCRCLCSQDRSDQHRNWAGKFAVVQPRACSCPTAGAHTRPNRTLRHHTVRRRSCCRDVCVPLLAHPNTSGQARRSGPGTSRLVSAVVRSSCFTFSRRWTGSGGAVTATVGRCYRSLNFHPPCESERVNVVAAANDHAVTCRVVDEGGAVADRHYRPALKVVCLPIHEGGVGLPGGSHAEIGGPPIELARRVDYGLILMQYQWISLPPWIRCGVHWSLRETGRLANDIGTTSVAVIRADLTAHRW